MKNISSFKKYLPLILVEMYLLATILLFFYGPVDWNIQNSLTLLLYLFSYHVMFVIGYVLYCKRGKGKAYDMKVSGLWDEFVIDKFWLILILAFVASIISYKNITFGESYIPYGFFDDIKLGIINPAQARNLYAEKLNGGFYANYAGGFYGNIILFFLAIFKYSLVPLLVYLWPRLSHLQKTFGLLIATIPVASGIAMSLSSINFFYFFVIGICCFIILISAKINCVLQEIKNRKGIVIALIFMFLFSFWQFYAVKSGANIYQVVNNNVKPATFNYLKLNGISFTKDSANSDVYRNFPIIYDFYEKLSVYITQGYKGMSLSLDKPFDSTYGIGHSIFLSRNFEKRFDLNILSKTFQRKITEQWDENIYWHSFYSYIANDVNFIGVTFVMFLLGYIFAKIYSLAIETNNILAKLSLPLFGVMFLYMPANNQILSFLENMSSFWVLMIIILLPVKAVYLICNRKR